MNIGFLNISLVYIKKYKHPYHTLPPIDIGYCSSLLKKEGHKINLIDTSVQNCTKQEILDSLKRQENKIIFLKPFIYMDSVTLDFAEEIKKFIKYIFVIGPTATLNPEKFIFYKSPIDACLLGEPEAIIEKLVKRINENNDYTDIEGLSYFDKKLIKKTIIFVKNLDTLPFLDHQLFQKGYLYHYPVALTKKLEIGFMFSSRGCPNDCLFCSPIERRSYGNKYRSRSTRNIIEEMEFLENQNKNYIYFADDLFTCNKNRVKLICKEIKKRKLNINWAMQSRVDLLDEDILKELKSSGCTTICLGLESGNDRILKILDKCYTREKIKTIMELIKKYKFLTVGYFIIGNPSETEEEIKQDIFFAKKLNLDLLQVSFFTIYPGSKAYKKYHVSQGLKHNLPSNFSELDCDALKGFQKRFYKEFYFSPRFMIRFIKKKLIFIIFNLKSEIKLLTRTLKFLINLRFSSEPKS